MTHSRVELPGMRGVDFAGKEIQKSLPLLPELLLGLDSLVMEKKKLLEVNHGGVLIARYAHANKLLVKVGDVVKRANHRFDGE